VSLAVLVRVLVYKTVDSSSTESGRRDALTFLASPRTGCFAATEGFNGSSYDGSFGGLLPLLLGLAAFSAWASRG